MIREKRKRVNNGSCILSGDNQFAVFNSGFGLAEFSLNNLTSAKYF